MPRLRYPRVLQMDGKGNDTASTNVCKTHLSCDAKMTGKYMHDVVSEYSTPIPVHMKLSTGGRIGTRFKRISDLESPVALIFLPNCAVGRGQIQLEKIRCL